LVEGPDGILLYERFDYLCVLNGLDKVL
jgi:hypothetical protein